jgi:hypothetical protein
MLINLQSSKSAGSEFDASLLRVARVIRQPSGRPRFLLDPSRSSARLEVPALP